MIEALQALDFQFKRFQYVVRREDTGSRSCRKITGGSGYSLHAYYINDKFTFWTGVAVWVAIAVDINWQSNPYGSRLVTNMPREMVEAVLATRTNNGKQVWGWGGNYRSNKDAMHYEIVCSPSDLATGINWGTVRGHQSSPAPAPPAPPGDDRQRPYPGYKGKYGGYNRREFERVKDGNVGWIQTQINRTNRQPKLVVDEFFGPATEDAVKGFQGAVGFRPEDRDGIVGPRTWAELQKQ